MLVLILDSTGRRPHVGNINMKYLVVLNILFIHYLLEYEARDLSSSLQFVAIERLSCFHQKEGCYNFCEVGIYLSLYRVLS